MSSSAENTVGQANRGTPKLRCVGLTAALLLCAAATSPAADVEPVLAALRAVGPKGAGSAEATQAWEKLAGADATQLPAILAGLDGASPLAANWIGAAADAVAQRAIATKTLPAGELERFLQDRKHAPRARRLAYEWLCQVDPTAPARLLGGMLDDPSLELRRDAVGRLMAEAAKLPQAEAPDAYRKALAAARDVDQIQEVAGRLAKLGVKIDLSRQLGCLTQWKIIGPWDNTDGRGFAAVYPPEEPAGAAFDKTYSGKPDAQGRPRQLRWIDHVVAHPMGWIDLNKVLVEEKLVVAYAAAEFTAERAAAVELRSGSSNALKIWVNGRLVASHESYHAGGQFDEYTAAAELRPGRNLILVKICQNNQPQEWGRDWNLHLRVCDALGGAVHEASAKEPTQP